jgi:hypothetical protein
VAEATRFLKKIFGEQLEVWVMSGESKSRESVEERRVQKVELWSNKQISIVVFVPMPNVCTLSNALGSMKKMRLALAARRVAGLAVGASTQ